MSAAINDVLNGFGIFAVGLAVSIPMRIFSTNQAADLFLIIVAAIAGLAMVLGHVSTRPEVSE